MIDTHLHLWDLASPPGWLTPDQGRLYRTFSPEEAREMHAEAGYTHALLVQVDDTRADTEHMIAVARANPWVIGVVGWVDLTEPSAVARDLQYWGTTAAGTGPIAGIRHLVHDDPRADFLDLPSVRESLAILAAEALPLDVPDAFPRHLTQAIRVADEVQGLRVVVDHLGKPPARPTGTEADSWRAWGEQLRDAADRPNIVAKISGLHHGGIPFDDDAARLAMDLALEAFTPGRLMLGSDWPMPLVGEGIQPLIAQRDNMLATLSPADRALLEGGTAERIYHVKVN